MDKGIEPHECVSCLLLKHTRILAEKRKQTKPLLPGVIALPGGHLEVDEAPEAALRRELHEELGITPRQIFYVCTLLHRSQEFRKVHYFAVPCWEGTLTNNEAEALLWLPLSAIQRLELDVDRTAVQEYLRIYAQATSGEGEGARAGPLGHSSLAHGGGMA